MRTHAQAPDSVVSITLEPHPVGWVIAPGRVLDGLGFNGTIPGPTIEAQVGQTVEISLKNALAESTTIHWHGLRVPAAMDGTQMVQQPIAPEDVFEYRFTVPDAGTFWYHPHTNETVQLEKGLYGALIVRDPDDPVFDHERVLVLDDVKLNRRGELAPFGGLRQRHDGRRGDQLLVNGEVDPTLVMSAGQVERWRIINASSSRYARLSLGGRRFLIIGTDGGLIDGAPQPASEVLLAPAERVDLAVGPLREGEMFNVETLPYSRGMISEEPGRYCSVRVGSAMASVADVPSVLRHIEPLAEPDRATNRVVHLQWKPSLRRGIDWQIDGHTHHQADPVRVGDLQVWDVVNHSRMDHPFHLHGFFFQVVSVNDQPPPYRAWKDTVNIPAAGRVRIVWLPDDRPGSWMYHCHILEHHAAGMMAHFDVVR
jgi:FtsP/CotA-like multicopper oxidase with cupredoxin domain